MFCKSVFFLIAKRGCIFRQEEMNKGDSIKNKVVINNLDFAAFDWIRLSSLISSFIACKCITCSTCLLV